MSSVIDWILTRYDTHRRRRQEKAAFANNRFALYLQRRGRLGAVLFLPRYDEAEYFFYHYVVPWMHRRMHVIVHTGPWGVTSRLTPRRAPFTEMFRPEDVESVRIVAATVQQREELEATLRRIELNRLEEWEKEQERAEKATNAEES